LGVLVSYPSKRNQFISQKQRKIHKFW